ncbi:MAG: hypothetical protein M3N82_02145 [Pseudomonadota bacterium]|nr:hypothetical protein [Pseudomonadota bacterium]
MTYDGVAQHTSIDNVDLRVADTFGVPDEHSLLAEVSINNNPRPAGPLLRADVLLLGDRINFDGRTTRPEIRPSRVPRSSRCDAPMTAGWP